MATSTYIGVSGGLWTTPGNWSPSGNPAAGSDIVITKNVTADSFVNFTGANSPLGINLGDTASTQSNAWVLTGTAIATPPATAWTIPSGGYVQNDGTPVYVGSGQYGELQIPLTFSNTLAKTGTGTTVFRSNASNTGTGTSGTTLDIQNGVAVFYNGTVPFGTAGSTVLLSGTGVALGQATSAAPGSVNYAISVTGTNAELFNSFTGAMTWSGSITVNASGFTVNMRNPLAAGSVGTLTLSGTVNVSTFGATFTTGTAVSSNIVVSGSVSGSGPIIKSGANTLTLSNANTLTGTVTASAGTLTLSNTLALQNAIFNTNSTGTVTFPASPSVGGLSGSTNRAFTTALTLGGTSTSAVWTGGFITNNITLTKQGTGTQQLGGNSTGRTTAATNINNGTIELGSATGLYAAGATGTITMTGGKLSSSSTTGYTLTNALTLNGTMTLGDAANTGALTFSGTTTLSGNTALTIPSAVTLSGVVAGAFNFTKAGANTLTLGAANTVSGTTQVTAGTLTLSNVNGLQNSTVDWGTSTVGTLSLPASAVLGGLSTASGTLNTFTQNGAYSVGNNNASATFGGVLAGTGAITKIGTGSWTLTGNNTNSGAVSVTAGTLNADSTTALGAASSTAGISVTSGTTLSLGGALNYSSPGRTTTISGTGVSGVDAGCLVLANAGPLNLGAINATNNTYIRGTTTTQLTSIIAWSGSGGLRLGAATGTTATFSGAISVSSGTLTAILFGRSNNPDLGTIVLGTTNTFAAPAQIDYGTLQISSDANLGTAPGAATAAYLIVGGNTTLATTGTFTLNANRGIALGPSSGSGTGTIDVASATTLTYAGIIANNSTGTGSLVKSSTGTLVLSGANTYTGTTTLASGTAQAGVAQNGSTSGPFGTSGTINMTGGTLQYSASNTVDYSARLGTETNGQWSIDTNGQNVTFGSTLTGATSSLVKTGSGTLSLTASNPFYGGTRVSGGTLSFVIGGLSDAGNIVINGGTLQWAGGATTDLSDRLVLEDGGSASVSMSSNVSFSYASSVGSNSTSSFTKLGTGGLLMTSVNGTWSGATTVSAGLMQVKTLNSGSYSASIVVNGQSLGVYPTSATTQTLSGAISGSGGMIFSPDATSTIIVSGGSNSYLGGTTLAGGKIVAGTASAFGTGTLTFVSAGAQPVIDVSTSMVISNAINLDDGSIIFAGSNNLELSSNINLPFSRPFTVNGSVLTLSGIVSGSGSKLTKAGTATLKLTGANTYSGGTDIGAGTMQAGNTQALGTTGTVTLTASGAALQTLTTGGQNGKLTVADLNNSAGGTIKIGG